MSRPIAGIGVGLRSEFLVELPSTTRELDFLEVIPENWAGVGGLARRHLEANLERWPIVPHSTSLSIGGPEPFDDEYLGWMREACRTLDAPYFTDHICYAQIGGMHTHELLPLPFTDEAVAHTAARIRQAQARFDVPLVFENPTFYAHMPGATMDEASFLAAILAEADCGMLLDVNNVYVNSLNHGFDPYAFIDRMPLARVRQIHLAGHSRHGDVVIDTHEGPIIDDVWALYRYTLARAGGPIPTLIEWDAAIPALDQVLDEVDRARAHAALALADAVAA